MCSQLSERDEQSIYHSWFLAHHSRNQLNHCLLLPLGGKRLALCARCLATYPSLVFMVILQALGILPRSLPMWIDVAIILALPLPALTDWARGRFALPGSNSVRLITGVFLGLSLGRSLWLYFANPSFVLFWIQMGLFLFVAIAVEVLAWQRR